MRQRRASGHPRRAHPLPDVVGLIEPAIEPDPPLSLADGGVIRNGFNADLDDLRNLAFNGKQWIADLQKTERERTGIRSLKVGFNNVFGYYIEITNTHKDKVPPDYIRKQTLTNAERYVTPELKEYEEKILHAEERILALETELFNEVRTAGGGTRRRDPEERAAARRARLLRFRSPPQPSSTDMCRPDVNDTTVLEITGGRHPVIERLLPPGEKYTPERRPARHRRGADPDHHRAEHEREVELPAAGGPDCAARTDRELRAGCNGR